MVNRKEQKEKARAEGHKTISCPICKHPLKLEMQRAYLNWQSPKIIVAAFNLSFPYAQAHVSSHMEVTGLRDKRKLSLHAALERIIETGAEKPITAGEVIHAVEAFCKIDDKGKWLPKDEENSGELTVNVINYSEVKEGQ
jgi:hypothetical protein